MISRFSPEKEKTSHPPRTLATMDWGSFTEDHLDQIVAGGERDIASIRMMQMGAMAEKKRRGSHLADGYRSIVDWMKRPR